MFKNNPQTERNPNLICLSWCKQNYKMLLDKFKTLNTFAEIQVGSKVGSTGKRQSLT